MTLVDCATISRTFNEATISCHIMKWLMHNDLIVQAKSEYTAMFVYGTILLVVILFTLFTTLCVRYSITLVIQLRECRRHSIIENKIALETAARGFEPFH